MNRLPSSLLLVVLTAGAVTAAGPEPAYKAPRTEDGQPDFRGVWSFSTGVPLQRPSAFAEKKAFTKEEFDAQRAAVGSAVATIARFAPVEAVGFDWVDTALHVNDLRTSLITYPENGRLPEVVEGVRRMPGFEDVITALAEAKGGFPPGLQALLAAFGGPKNGPEDFIKSERCLVGLDVPFVPQLGGSYVHIIQGRDHVGFVTDISRRIVAVDGKPALGATLRSWSGSSRGRWEGETLVVDTRNFDDQTASFAGAGKSRDKVVTERFRLTARNVIEYTATVVDPKTFRDKIEVSFPMARVDAHIYEDACHEGNRSMTNSLSAARKADEEARNAPSR
jgi:hypothetical protein